MAEDHLEELYAQRGDDAKRIINDPILRQALEELERDIVQGMKALTATDLEGRDALWRELRALSSFKIKIKQYVSRGDVARKTLLQRATDFIKGQ
jgi:hypothetical protein